MGKRTQKMTGTELDNLVEQWHADESIRVPLHQHLGMTREEYAAWVECGAGCGCERCGDPREGGLADA